MKKLLLKSVLLGAIVAALVLALTPFTKGDSGSLTRRYQSMPEKIHIANTGDSHAHRALDYADTGYTGFNFGLASQTLTADYNLIDTYIDRFDEGAVLLIGVSYYTPWADDTSDPQRQARNMRYLGVLDSDHIQFDSKADYLMNRFAPALTWADRKVITIFKGGQAGQMDEDDVQKSDLTMAEIGEKRAQYHMRHIYQDGEMLPFNEDSLACIDKMAALCRERGVRCALLVTPYTKEYSKWFMDEAYPVFTEKMEEVSRRVDAPLLDYSSDERFTSREDLFRDSDHLNEEGARLFTAQVIHDLENAGLLTR